MQTPRNQIIDILFTVKQCRDKHVNNEVTAFLEVVVPEFQNARHENFQQKRTTFDLKNASYLQRGASETSDSNCRILRLFTCEEGSPRFSNSLSVISAVCAK